MKYFKGTLKQYTALNKAISDKFNYPYEATVQYYSPEPREDVDGNCVMEVDGFIQDKMPEVFTDIILHDTVEYPIDETKL